ncbi:MAG: helical backbone metal receptor [Candidatus Melainabacteria bacterium]|nr:helical backbone metal receptor [Candidatus Melainabacteria bacterium]
MISFRILLGASVIISAIGLSPGHCADANPPIDKKSSQKSQSQEATPRVVSLAPSNTELIYSLGADNCLIGVSSYCLYPAQTKTKQKVGSFVAINWEKIATLKPNVVALVSGQEALDIQLKKHNIKSMVLRNESLDDIATNLITLGTVCSAESKARQMATDYRQALSELKSILKDSPKRKVFLCVWPKPIVTVGGASFLNEVINVCGGTNVAAGMKGSYPKCGPEKIIAMQPDVLIMPYESKDLKLASTPPWSLLSAVKKKQFYFLPDREHDYLSRPTLRIFKGLLRLSLDLHPEKKHELTKWGLKVAGDARSPQ